MTSDEAKALAGTEWWLHATPRQIAEFQMSARLLCCPFNVFHKALSEALGRDVYTHEFGLNWEGLEAELRGERTAPTLEEILELIPAEKRIVIQLPPRATQPEEPAK